MDTFNSLLKTHMSEGEVLSMIAFSNEFESMMVREVRRRGLLCGTNQSWCWSEGKCWMCAPWSER